MTNHVQLTGATVAPGELIYRHDVAINHLETDVVAGVGCYARVCAARNENGQTSTASAVLERHIVASRLGVVQWDGNTVSVYNIAHTLAASQDAISAGAPSPSSSPEAAMKDGQREAASTLGPRPGDLVYVRIKRVSRLFAMGEIIGINGAWCCGANAANVGGFRGLLRLEDIRPFKPTKDTPTPPPPAASFAAGDVVYAEVISQSDARQYQLSTMAEGCGVVEAIGADGQRLRHVPQRRDVMSGANGEAVPRWCPLVPPPAPHSTS